jgi:hypothetical protein
MLETGTKVETACATVFFYLLRGCTSSVLFPLFGFSEGPAEIKNLMNCPFVSERGLIIVEGEYVFLRKKKVSIVEGCV